jgi:hypothetical protein
MDDLANRTFSIIHTEWSYGFGGQEHRILLECREMDRRGRRVMVVSRPEATLLPRAEKASIPVPTRSSAYPYAVRAMTRIFGDTVTAMEERTEVFFSHLAVANGVSLP